MPEKSEEPRKQIEIYASTKAAESPAPPIDPPLKVWYIYIIISLAYLLIGLGIILSINIFKKTIFTIPKICKNSDIIYTSPNQNEENDKHTKSSSSKECVCYFCRYTSFRQNEENDKYTKSPFSKDGKRNLDVTIEILRLVDEVLIAITILYAGALLRRAYSDLAKRPNQLLSALKEVDVSILSMVVITLSVHFLTDILEGNDKVTFTYGISNGFMILCLSTYVGLHYYFFKSNQRGNKESQSVSN